MLWDVILSFNLLQRLKNKFSKKFEYGNSRITKIGRNMCYYWHAESQNLYTDTERIFIFYNHSSARCIVWKYNLPICNVAWVFQSQTFKGLYMLRVFVIRA